MSSCNSTADSSGCVLDLLPAKRRRDKSVTLLETLSHIEDTGLSVSVLVDLLELYVLTLRRFEARGEGSKSSDILLLLSKMRHTYPDLRLNRLSHVALSRNPSSSD